jgi:hypothetical protein
MGILVIASSGSWDKTYDERGGIRANLRGRPPINSRGSFLYFNTQFNIIYIMRT